MTSLIKPFAGAVFDLDGTLLDTELVFKSVMYDVAARLGLEMREEVHQATIGVSHEVTTKILLGAFGAGFPHETFTEKCRMLMRERMDLAVPVKAGVVDILDGLAAMGIPMAVATSSRRAHAGRHLRTAGLMERFVAVVTREDVTHPKPHPEPYLTAARHLGVAPGRCLAIEDSATGIVAAHAAGMQCVMVPDLVPASADIARLCAAVLPDLHAVKAAVLRAGVSRGPSKT